MTEPVVTEPLREASAAFLKTLEERGYMVVTAESCTGGLIGAGLTAIPGSSAVVDRGFVTYSNDAKHEMLGVDMALIKTYGAVSELVACAMAQGALRNSKADISLAVTGVAGPGGGSREKPVGRVHIAASRKSGPTFHEKLDLGDIGRDQIREQTALKVLALALKLV